MKKLNTSSVTTAVGFYVKSGVWNHLQNAYREAIAETVKAQLGDAYSVNSVYILSGLRNSGAGQTFTISAGAVFYNGEVYLVDAATFTAPVGQTAVASIVQTQYTDATADPVLFSDGQSRNMLDIFKIQITSGVSGSTIADYTSFLPTNLTLKNTQSGNMPSSLALTFTQDESVFFATASNDVTLTFDPTNARPGTVKRLKWTFGASRTITLSFDAATQKGIKDGGDLTKAASNTNVLYVMYVGKNESGLHEFSYTVKQV